MPRTTSVAHGTSQARPSIIRNAERSDRLQSSSRPRRRLEADLDAFQRVRDNYLARAGTNARGGSPMKDNDPNDALRADRAASFTVSLMAFSGATPATWTPSPFGRRSAAVALNVVHERRRQRETGEFALALLSLALRLHKIHGVDRGRAGRARREADRGVRRPERRHESHGGRHEQCEQ